LIEGDLNELPLVDLLRGRDWVFHLAAQPGVRSSWGPDFETYMRSNIGATQSLLEAAARTRSLRRLVYASSSSVYGDASSLPVPEEAALDPISPYGMTKMMAERLCQLYAKSFRVPAVSLRFSSISFTVKSIRTRLRRGRRLRSGDDGGGAGQDEAVRGPRFGELDSHPNLAITRLELGDERAQFVDPVACPEVRGVEHHLSLVPGQLTVLRLLRHGVDRPALKARMHLLRHLRRERLRSRACRASPASR